MKPATATALVYTVFLIGCDQPSSVKPIPKEIDMIAVDLGSDKLQDFIDKKVRITGIRKNAKKSAILVAKNDGSVSFILIIYQRGITMS